MAGAAFSIGWEQFGAAIGAVGSLGVAAFGVTESLGKAFAFTFRKRGDHRLGHWGLPYVGLKAVLTMTRPLHLALRCAYGEDYPEVIAQQYRAARIDGSAPDTIRQGVRLGLPFLDPKDGADLIAAVWHMERGHAEALALALQAEAPERPVAAKGKTHIDPAQALAGRFATALDARINAAFQLADEQYEAAAKMWAGVAAVILAAGFNWGLVGHDATTWWQGLYPWPVAIGAGLVAVPLAPVAKDLSTSLQNALTSFRSISGKSS